MIQAEETKLKGCFLIRPKIFSDNRGYFFETFNKLEFNEAIHSNVEFVQDNQSMSGYGTIRGLHYQEGKYAQAKLVRVIEGRVLDIALDLRKGSPSFGSWFAVELSGENNLQLFIPKGFAHGFSVLSEQAVFSYKCDSFYNKEAEKGIRFDDNLLQIDWLIPTDKIILSPKDLLLPNFQKDYEYF